LLQGVQLPISSIGTLTSEVTSAITATTQVAKQILNQSLAQVKVHLKANYMMYIKEETEEDRQKREAEEAEIERMLKEMQIQQNAPVKKNPLTEIIGDF
ncbi:conjugal transfer protein TraM, partial [Bacteroides sp. MSK.18.37]